MPMRRVPSVLVSQEKKKKKLVIGGVGIHDERRVDGVRRWCEVCVSDVLKPSDLFS